MEITLELAEAYLQDRANELLSDCNSGTPFVFINAMGLLNVLASLLHVYLKDLPVVSEIYDMDAIKVAGQNLTQFFSLTEAVCSWEESVRKLQLVHDESQMADPASTLVAEPFVQDVKKAITATFAKLNSDKIAGLKVLVVLNEHPFVGYGN